MGKDLLTATLRASARCDASTFGRAEALAARDDFHGCAALILQERGGGCVDCGGLLAECFARLNGDLYLALGVPAGEAGPRVKKSYRRLCLLYHPDKCGGKTTELFHLLQRAWEVLGDDASRARYDRSKPFRELFVGRPPEPWPATHQKVKTTACRKKNLAPSTAYEVRVRASRRGRRPYGAAALTPGSPYAKSVRGRKSPKSPGAPRSALRPRPPGGDKPRRPASAGAARPAAKKATGVNLRQGVKPRDARVRPRPPPPDTPRAAPRRRRPPTATATATWSRAPPAGAPRWYCMTNDDAVAYYWHSLTGDTAWDHPGEDVWRECAAPDLPGRKVYSWAGPAAASG
ncbi:hypothetical protein JL720_14329 [Aureococcus anophagefferens]|nr:hypothetical protein JL720_14329 [Aureococcus anophagefferens]